MRSRLQFHCDLQMNCDNFKNFNGKSKDGVPSFLNWYFGILVNLCGSLTVEADKG